MFIIIFIVNIIFALFIRFYLIKRLPVSSQYSKSLLRTITMQGLTLGLGSLISSILNIIRSKDGSDLRGDSIVYYNKLSQVVTDGKIPILLKFNFLTILMFLALLNVFLYRVLQFSLILPLKTLINTIGFMFLGFNITDYVDEIYIYYLPYVKQWLNNHLGMGFSIPEYIPREGWKPEDIQLVKTMQDGYEVLREVRYKLSGDEEFYNEAQSMLGGSELPESEESTGLSKTTIVGILLILAGLGFGIYYFYGDSISEYFNGSEGPKGPKGEGPKDLTGSEGIRPRRSKSFSKTFQEFHRDGKPPWFGKASNNVMLNPDNTVRWYWNQSELDWVSKKPHSGFIPSDPSAIMESDLTPRASREALINAVRSPRSTASEIAVLSPSSSSSSSSNSPIVKVKEMDTYFPIAEGKTFEAVTSGFASSTRSGLPLESEIPKGFKLNIERSLSLDTSVTGNLLTDYISRSPGVPLTPMRGELFSGNNTSSQSVPEIQSKYGFGEGLKVIDRMTSTVPNSPMTPRTYLFNYGIPQSKPSISSIAEEVPLPESKLPSPKLPSSKVTSPKVEVNK